MPFHKENGYSFTYKTSCMQFQQYYDQVCLAVVKNMIRDDLRKVCDAGMIQFMLIYQSNTKIKKEFFVPIDMFDGLQDLILQMCPKMEDIRF